VDRCCDCKHEDNIYCFKFHPDEPCRGFASKEVTYVYEVELKDNLNYEKPDSE